MGRSVPSSESSTRSKCCRSPKTIWEVRVTLPFSFSLCCTRSERRMVSLLHWARLAFHGHHVSRLFQRGLHCLVRDCEYMGDYVPLDWCGKVGWKRVVPDVQHGMQQEEYTQN